MHFLPRIPSERTCISTRHNKTFSGQGGLFSLEGQRAGNQCLRHEIEDTGVRVIYPQDKELPLDREGPDLVHMQRVDYKQKGGRNPVLG